VKVQLELERLEQIQQVMDTGVPEIVAGMLETMSNAVEQVERAMIELDLAAAAKAAHAARNDALLVGARALLGALTEVEEAARGGDATTTGAALLSLRRVWPSTRDELARVAARGD
jgi:hypothetical protein